MSGTADLKAALCVVEGEIDRLDRERLAAEAYSEFGSTRPQRLFRRAMELQHERTQILRAIEEAELADAADLSFLDAMGH